jgi:hypothetical protein
VPADQPAAFRDRFRDPWGWFIDRLPWPLRRLYLSVQYREWVPNGARYIGLRRPPQEAFEWGRQRARESSDPDLRAAVAAWDLEHPNG